MNKTDFIVIPGTNDAISRSVVATGNNFQNAHFEINEYSINNVGLVVPSIKKFMKYFLSVKEATFGVKKLYTLDNKQIPPDEVEELWGHWASNLYSLPNIYLSNHIIQDINGRFYNACDFRIFTGVFTEENIKVLKPIQINPLEECVMDDVYVDMIFNKQGFPIKKSRNQTYKEGKNIKFCYPQTDGVISFGYSYKSNETKLNCQTIKKYSTYEIGVLGYAEGVLPKK